MSEQWVSNFGDGDTLGIFFRLSVIISDKKKIVIIIIKHIS